jgi:translation initiation factor IF-2
MANKDQKNERTSTVSRPPVVAVMGHIDHGKSTLLDYIRKTNVAGGEAGGITQHLGAYEVAHTGKDGVEHRITFLDTPGHEAFRGIRERGATVADIAILVVSAEEGVKPQTLEALSFIKKTETPYIVAITKIDKPHANVERTKQSLAEKETYLEGYGGDIPFAPVSAKTGEGIDDLLDLILIVAELEELRGNDKAPLEAYVIEAEIDKQKGISATLIVREGTLRGGACVVAEHAFAPTRQLEDFAGRPTKEAHPGTPVRVIGWSELPRVGAKVRAVKTKREAEVCVAAQARGRALPETTSSDARSVIPIIVKADAGGSLEAVESELMKLQTEKVALRVVGRGLGEISEGDARMARGSKDAIIVGFNVGIDAPASAIVERDAIPAATFEIIYKLLEWVAGLVKARTPKERVETVKGSAKILKVFTTEKDRQILGGRVLEGELTVGDEFRIYRRDAHIGTGRLRDLERQKEKTSSVGKDSEFGVSVSASTEVMTGDRIEAFTVTEQ